MNKLFGWESEEEKLLRYMKMPPRRKLEILNDTLELTCKCMPKETKKAYWKVRELRAMGKL